MASSDNNRNCLKCDGNKYKTCICLKCLNKTNGIIQCRCSILINDRMSERKHDEEVGYARSPGYYKCTMYRGDWVKELKYG